MHRKSDENNDTFYFKIHNNTASEYPIIMPISFEILLSFFLFLTTVTIFPVVIRTYDVMIITFDKNELKGISVTETTKIGVIINIIAIIYSVRLTLLAFISSHPFQ